MKSTQVALFIRYIIFLLIISHIYHVDCQTGADAKNLRKKLFVTDSYQKTVRPTDTQAQAIQVYLNFYLLSINGLDERTETLQTTGYLTIYWNDFYLKWTPADYGNITDYKWPQTDIWKPDVALRNSFLEYKELGVDTLNVYVSHEGLVNWQPFQVFKSTCDIDITYFPFDIQTCQLKFVAWSYATTEVEMLSAFKGIIVDDFEKSSEWDLLDTSWSLKEESGEASVIFSLKIKRKPLWVMLIIVIPIVLLAILNIFVFVLPCESGERAGYAMTVFLSFAVFLTIVSDSLPRNSEKVAIFSIYLIIQTVQSTLITLVALVSLRCFSFDSSTQIPKCLLVIAACITCKCCRRRSRSTKVQDLDNSSKGETRDGGISKVNVRSSEYLEDAQEGNSHNTDYTWQNVFYSLDLLCFIVFTIILIVSTCVCFGLAASQT